MLNQRTAAIAIHRIGIRFTCALLLMSASSLASAQECAQSELGSSYDDCLGAIQEGETKPTDCISEFRQSAAGDSGCELEDVTVDGNTCTLTGSCQADDGGWDSFNYDANIDDVDALQNCDGELRAECPE